MQVTKKDLMKVVDELNDKIVDPPIKKKDEVKMKKKILQASKLIETDDNISKESMSVIKALKGSKSKKATKSKATKSKAIKPKASKTKGKKKEGTKRPGITAFILENMRNGNFEGLSNDKIIKKVQKEFPNANTKAKVIPAYWNMSKKKAVA
jgi:hypothetical protein